MPGPFIDMWGSVGMTGKVRTILHILKRGEILDYIRTGNLFNINRIFARNRFETENKFLLPTL